MTNPQKHNPMQPVKLLLFLLFSFCLFAAFDAEAWRLSFVFAVLTIVVFPFSATNN